MVSFIVDLRLFAGLIEPLQKPRRVIQRPLFKRTAVDGIRSSAVCWCCAGAVRWQWHGCHQPKDVLQIDSIENRMFSWMHYFCMELFSRSRSLDSGQTDANTHAVQVRFCYCERRLSAR